MKYKRRVKLVLLICGIFVVVGGVIGVVRHVTTFSSFPLIFLILKGSIVGLLIAGSVSFLEYIYLPDKLRRFNFLTAIFIKAVIYTVMAILIYLAVTYLFIPWLPMDFQMSMFILPIAITFIAVLISTFFLSLTQLLGGKVLFNFFTGKYHRPVEERRIFLLADLVSSTTIAEKIGHRDFHRFLNEFILDITEPILASNGEIYKYVGDEVIVAWFLKDKRVNYNCIACCFEMLRSVERNRAKYIKTYGHVPEFRAGLHCGVVVTGEMGDYKKEIAFLGDVMNTTARIQEEAKAENKTILISRPLLNEITFPAGITTKSIGTIRLRGKEDEIELFSIEEQ